jgi:hypothetical protein
MFQYEGKPTKKPSSSCFASVLANPSKLASIAGTTNTAPGAGTHSIFQTSRSGTNANVM